MPDKRANERVTLPAIDGVEVEIDPDVIARLEALPDKQVGAIRRQWTPAEDAIILRYYPVKRAEDLGEVLKSSDKTIRRRYRMLTRQTDAR